MRWFLIPSFSKSWPHNLWKSRDGEVESIAENFKAQELTGEAVGLEPVVYTEILKRRVAYCPSCRNRYGKSIDEVLVFEGPLYPKRELGEGRFKPMIKLSTVYKCSLCGYTSTKKSILLPLEAHDILQNILKPELVEKIAKVKEKSEVLESVLNRILS